MPRVARTLAMALGLFGAVVASQGPEFAQQYRQRLGGAIDELSRVMARFDADAQGLGESRDGAIDRLSRNADAVAARQGAAMRDHAARLERLRRQRAAMSEPGAFGRLVAFAKEMDPDLAGATYRTFEPAVPVTEEGIVAAVAGFLAGFAGTLGLGTAGRRLMRRRRRPVETSIPA